MSRRIEIELTSARPDGTWTWRAAGAREPKGVLDGTLLPPDSRVGGVLKADAEYELDGITILAVMSTKGKADKAGLLEILPSAKPFEAVTQQLAGRDRGDRGDRGSRGPRRDGDSRPPRRDGEGRGPRREGEGAPRNDRGPRPDRPVRAADGADRGPRPERRTRPHFNAPPELPVRPKAKRLKPGRVHRNAVLADLPAEQRAVAERALQGGLPSVRSAVNEQNVRLKAEGKEEIPAAGLLAMAEQMMPKLRVAEWLDRADAALADIEELDLRDLRSVVAAADDPMVARDDSTREVAARLKEALVTKQEKELNLWFEDIDAAVGVGRLVRALKLSSQPPKAGIRFPTELAGKLAAATTANLTADALPDRWVAVLEAAAFSPIRTMVQPTTKPTQVSDELLATVKRIASLLPTVAALFGIEATGTGQAPKPLRPTRPAAPVKKAVPPPPAAAPKPAAVEAAAPAEIAAETAVEEAPVEVEAAAEIAVEEAPVELEAAAETAVEEAPVEVEVETAVEEAPVEVEAAAETAVEEAPVEVETAVEEAPVEVPAEAEAEAEIVPDEAPVEVPAEAEAEIVPDEAPADTEA